MGYFDDDDSSVYYDSGPAGSGAAPSGQRGDWWGTQSTATVLPSTLEAGDPQYNQRQAEFESTVDWKWIEDNLRREAEERGVAYDPSDLAGIRRNSGYDQTHLGDAGLYNSALQKYYSNALQNYDERANNIPGGGGGSSTGSGGGLSGAPNFMQPFSEMFSAPTADDLLKDPSFLGRLQAGTTALERAAAKRGTLLTGGHLKGLSNFASDYASQEYGNVYQRAMNEYMNRANIHFTNEGNRYNSQRTNRMDDWGINLDEFNMNRATANDQFNQLFSFASLGNPAGLANIYGNYGNSGAGIITGAGNSAAAGQVGAANAWNQGLTNVGNIANSAYAAWLRSRPTTGAP